MAGAVFLANAGLLVLQLAAGRLLAPFVGSSLETWTAVIGCFLLGIALGNAAGGRIADRAPTGRRLAAALVAGAVAALWMVAFPRLLAETGLHRTVPLGVRVPALAAVLCFPAGFALSLPTPLAVRIGLADIRLAGRVAGGVFAVGTLGCLAGNYAAGFYLIPHLTVDAIVAAVAGGLFAAAGVVAIAARDNGPTRVTVPALGSASRLTGSLPLPRACRIVFLTGFAGMALELAAARLLAQVVGVSLYTWTGVIGVVLAGTAAGNWLGGVLADGAGRSPDPDAPGRRLAASLVAAALTTAGLLVILFALTWSGAVDGLPLVGRVLIYSFAPYFPAAFALGTVSPQVVRLAVPDVGHVGRTAGRVYAWSTAGAICGTFAAGYGLIPGVGMYRTVLAAALLPAVAAVAVYPVWRRVTLLYPLSLAAGLVAAGFLVLTPDVTGIARETNYFTIRVTPETADGRPVLALQLDMLIHSKVDPADPTYLFYPHEQVQMELLRARAAAGSRVLVVGGGGYTFPRCARTLVPSSAVDVVEIDPGVTEVAYSKLGLDPALGITSFNMDGRQFVAERAAAGGYDLVTLDAVNDLTVPAHLLTTEFNAEVRRTLAPGGVYLLTVIDHLADGRLWQAAAHTLRETYPHVRLITPSRDADPGGKQVMVLYASAAPLDEPGLWAELARQGVAEPFTRPLPADEQARLLAAVPPLVLTDQFAPVDNLMADVFRRRNPKLAPAVGKAANVAKATKVANIATLSKWQPWRTVGLFNRGPTVREGLGTQRPPSRSGLC